ncbi:L-type lectin-like domain-containing protein [Penicillium diatomitis]|uniref:L-type lectin-like domain-containing protein n=1 Tax=Penicillium diatomitis TaxID=2819901 RepID=A0A9W9X5C5_9EURO|nr:L-type lectin-like domain-containing protein [Penicillium diatomitis]KAJ5484124.1 L-type lectin-like domain-containing protein [Penicillium diatomitis]
MHIPIISSLLCLAGLSAVPVNAYSGSNPDIKAIPLRTHSLTPPYLDSDFQSRWFDFGGDTVIRADKYVRLTADRPSQQGWVFSRVPLTATNWEVRSEEKAQFRPLRLQRLALEMRKLRAQANQSRPLQIEVEFEIHGNGNLHGDGLALWLTKQRATQGPVFGSTDRFEGLGIFIDTYKNNRPGVSFPYVMAMMGDGETTYDQAHDGKANELAGCSARGLRNAPVPTKLRLTYFQDKSLSLDLQYKTEDTWTNCFNLNAEQTKIAIPSVAYLGLSAETGELSDNHDIISVKSENLYALNRHTPGGSKADPKSRNSGGNSYPTPHDSGSWSWFFVKFILFIGVCVGGYFGWTFYRTKVRASRF